MPLDTSAQDTYWKYHDPFDGENEEPYDMHIVNDTIYIWGRGGCDGENCLQYYVLGMDGEPILSRRYPGIIATRRTAFLEDHFYLTGRQLGDSLSGFDGHRIFKFDIKGDLIGTEKYSIDDLVFPPAVDIKYYIPYGVASQQDRLVLYGYVEEEGPFFRAVMTWFDTSLHRDTTVFITNQDGVSEIWDAKEDNDGLLTILYDYNVDPSPVELDEYYRTYMKYDKDGHQVYRWDGDIKIEERFLHIPMCITRDNDVVFAVTEPEGQNRSKDIVKVNKNGELVWRQRLDEQLNDENRAVLDLIETEDGNILGCGFFSSNQSYAFGSLIFKLDGSSGELQWDRVYADWNDPRGDSSIRSFFRSMYALPGGNILAMGQRPLHEQVGTYLIRNDDLFIMKVDAEGCLEEGCGGTEQHIAGEPFYENMFSSHSLRYYIDTNSENGYSRCLSFPFPSGYVNDSIYYFLKSEKYFEVRNNLRYELTSEEKYIFSAANKTVHALVEQDTFLLYDFKLEEGDLFHSNYIDQPLRVIETDTMRLDNRTKMRYWILECTENPEHTITWMEKIGTYHGVLWPRNFCNGDYGDQTLTCYYRFERLAHANPDVGGCFISNTIDQNKAEDSNYYFSYPNPATDELHIKNEVALIFSGYRIYDIHGHSLLEGSLIDQVIDISFLDSGIYLLELSNQDEIQVEKFIKE